MVANPSSTRPTMGGEHELQYDQKTCHIKQVGFTAWRMKVNSAAKQLNFQHRMWAVPITRTKYLAIIEEQEGGASYGGAAEVKNVKEATSQDDDDQTEGEGFGFKTPATAKTKRPISSTPSQTRSALKALVDQEMPEYMKNGALEADQEYISGEMVFIDQVNGKADTEKESMRRAKLFEWLTKTVAGTAVEPMLSRTGKIRFGDIGALFYAVKTKYDILNIGKIGQLKSQFFSVRLSDCGNDFFAWIEKREALEKDIRENLLAFWTKMGFANLILPDFYPDLYKALDILFVATQIKPMEQQAKKMNLKLQGPQSSVPSSADIIRQLSVAYHQEQSIAQFSEDGKRNKGAAAFSAKNGTKGDLAAAAGSTNKECNFFKKNRTCKFGDKCKFQHIDVSGTADKSKDDKKKSESGAPDTKSEKAKRECTFCSKKGHTEEYCWAKKGASKAAKKAQLAKAEGTSNEQKEGVDVKAGKSDGGRDYKSDFLKIDAELDARRDTRCQRDTPLATMSANVDNLDSIDNAGLLRLPEKLPNGIQILQRLSDGGLRVRVHGYGDTGANINVTKQELFDLGILQPASSGAVSKSIQGFNGDKSVIEKVGDLNGLLGNSQYAAKEFAAIPSAADTLFSLPRLAKDGFTFVGDADGLRLFKTGNRKLEVGPKELEVASFDAEEGQLGLYPMHMDVELPASNPLAVEEGKNHVYRAVRSGSPELKNARGSYESYLEHVRGGHISDSMLAREEGRSRHGPFECKVCAESNMRRKTSRKACPERYDSYQAGEYLATDVSGPWSRSVTGKIYRIHLVCLKTHYSVVSFLAKKTDAWSELDRMIIEIRALTGNRARFLRADNDGIFRATGTSPCREYLELLQRHKITPRPSAPNFHNSNAQAEVTIEWDENVVRPLMLQSNAPGGYWEFAAREANFLRTRVWKACKAPDGNHCSRWSKATGIFDNVPPSHRLDGQRAWGCDVVYIPGDGRKGLKSQRPGKGRKGTNLGHADYEQNAFIIRDFDTKRLFTVSINDITFYEDKFSWVKEDAWTEEEKAMGRNYRPTREMDDNQLRDKYLLSDEAFEDLRGNRGDFDKIAEVDDNMMIDEVPDFGVSSSPGQSTELKEVSEQLSVSADSFVSPQGKVMQGQPVAVPGAPVKVGGRDFGSASPPRNYGTDIPDDSGIDLRTEQQLPKVILDRNGYYGVKLACSSSQQHLLTRADLVPELMADYAIDRVLKTHSVGVAKALVALSDDDPKWLVGASPQQPAPRNDQEAAASKYASSYLAADNEELSVHDQLGSYEMVKRSSVPAGNRVLGSRMVRAHKEVAGSDGTIKLFAKSRLVCQGFNQIEGLNYFETFASTLQLPTLRMLLVESMRWPGEDCVEHWDVKAAFLNAKMDEEVYMEIPSARLSKEVSRREFVWRLRKAIYGTKQAARSWQLFLKDVCQKAGFKRSELDTATFYRCDASGGCWVPTQVDDMFIFSFGESGRGFRSQLWKELTKVVVVKNLGTIQWALKMNVQRVGEYPDRIMKLSMAHYVDEVLSRFSLDEVRERRTPLEIGAALPKGLCKCEACKPDAKHDGDEWEVDDSFPIREAVGSLIWLTTMCRPDISLATHYLSKLASVPSAGAWRMFKHVMGYLKRTKHLGIVYRTGAAGPTDIQAWVDSSFGNLPGARSTWGGVLDVSGGPVWWKCGTTKATLSTAEAETHALVNFAKEVMVLKELWEEIGLASAKEGDHLIKTGVIKFREDNTSTITNSKSGSATKRYKYYAAPVHWLQHQIDDGHLQVVYVETKEQKADIFTKTLPGAVFDNLLQKTMGCFADQEAFPESLGGEVNMDVATTAKMVVFRANAVRMTVSPGGPEDQAADAIPSNTPTANADADSEEVKSVGLNRGWNNVDLTATPIGNTSRNLSTLLYKASSVERKIKRINLRDIVVDRIRDSQVSVHAGSSFWFTAEILDLDVIHCEDFPSRYDPAWCRAVKARGGPTFYNVGTKQRFYTLNDGKALGSIPCHRLFSEMGIVYTDPDNICWPYYPGGIHPERLMIYSKVKGRVINENSFVTVSGSLADYLCSRALDITHGDPFLRSLFTGVDMEENFWKDYPQMIGTLAVRKGEAKVTVIPTCDDAKLLTMAMDEDAAKTYLIVSSLVRCVVDHMYDDVKRTDEAVRELARYHAANMGKLKNAQDNRLGMVPIFEPWLRTPRGIAMIHVAMTSAISVLLTRPMLTFNWVSGPQTAEQKRDWAFEIRGAKRDANLSTWIKASQEFKEFEKRMSRIDFDGLQSFGESSDEEDQKQEVDQEDSESEANRDDDESEDELPTVWNEEIISIRDEVEKSLLFMQRDGKTREDMLKMFTEEWHFKLDVIKRWLAGADVVEPMKVCLERTALRWLIKEASPFKEVGLINKFGHPSDSEGEEEDEEDGKLEPADIKVIVPVHAKHSETASIFMHLTTCARLLQSGAHNREKVSIGEAIHRGYAISISHACSCGKDILKLTKNGKTAEGLVYLNGKKEFHLWLEKCSKKFRRWKINPD